MCSYKTRPIERNLASLSGQRIVLTRAAADNDELAQLLRQQQAIPLLFPCLQIAPVDNPTAWQDTLQNMPPPDGVIVTSAHAVDAVYKHWPDNWSDVSCYAVGPVTAARMQERGLPTPSVPTQHSSEGILESLDASQISGHRWVIIGGEDPRPLLEQSLTEHGARVTHIACYQRLCPSYSPQTTERMVIEQPTLVVIQSVTALKNWASSLGISKKHDLWSIALLLPEQRYESMATELGFCGTFFFSHGPTNEAILDAIASITTRSEA